MTRRASCGLMYGAMNSTKTTNLGRIARYIFERYGLTSRLISADNEYDTLENEIDEGIIEPFAIVNVPYPFSTLTKLSKGMWPTTVRRGNISAIEMQLTPPEKMAKIGAYLIEGTTTIAEMLHQDHIRNGRAIGEDVVGKFVQEDITFAKSARSHYQQVQDYLTLDLIPTFSMLPVRWVWWTGHEYTGEDEATGQTRLGPGVIGKAATMRVPRKVGNTFHMTLSESTKLDPQTKKNIRTLDYRAYFEPHASGIGQIMWPAGVKIPVDWVTAWRARFPEGFIPLELKSGIEQFIKFIDDQSEAAGKSRAVTPTPPEQSKEPTAQAAVPTASAAVQGAPLPPGRTPKLSDIAPPDKNEPMVVRPGIPPATQTRPGAPTPTSTAGVLGRPVAADITAAQSVYPPAPRTGPATQTRPGATPIRRPMVPPRPLVTPKFATASRAPAPPAVSTTPPDKIAETLQKSIEQAKGGPLFTQDVNAIPDINAIPGGQPGPAQVPNQREDSNKEEVK